MTERDEEQNDNTTNTKSDKLEKPTVGGAGAAQASPAAAVERNAGDVEYDLIAAMKSVYDPEIPVDIYELGLIYELNVADDLSVHIIMTLTTPMCPAAEILPPEVEAKAREVEGVTDVRLELVWEPPWNMDMMSPAARLQLNV